MYEIRTSNQSSACVSTVRQVSREACSNSHSNTPRMPIVMRTIPAIPSSTSRSHTTDEPVCVCVFVCVCVCLCVRACIRSYIYRL